GKEERGIEDIDNVDTLTVGILQGLSVVPGVSRSGSTVFGLLYRKFDGKNAFKLSFILSVPAVLVANIGIGVYGFAPSRWMILSTFVAFVTGYITIDVLLKMAGRIRVSY
ncbi:MAG: undecaprenyl-diphosphate phosphatase, partial [Candidatus Aenigmatarchaeota archaeon]